MPSSRPDGSHFLGSITRCSATLDFIQRPPHPVGYRESLTFCKPSNLIEIPLIDQNLEPITHAMCLA